MELILDGSKIIDEIMIKIIPEKNNDHIFCLTDEFSSNQYQF